MSYFSENLRTLRLARGYTHEQMSEQLHIQRQSYGSYENGKRSPDMNMTLSIAQVLQVPLETLLLESYIDEQLARIITCYIQADASIQKEIADFITNKVSKI